MDKPVPREVHIRAPGDPPPKDIPAPSPAFLCRGPWTVLYSTLPYWKKRRNVRIKYGLLPFQFTPRLDDLVTYQSLTSDTVNSIHGADRAGQDGWSWGWRGNGWLLFLSSRWEILGYGTLGAAEGEVGEAEGRQWVVTYFRETLFTPAGIDIYARPRAYLPDPLLEEIKAKLKSTGDARLETLTEELFMVKHDGDYK